MPIPDDHGSPHRRWNHPAGPSDVCRFTIGAEHDPGDGGITGDLPHLFRGEDLAGNGLMDTTSSALQSVQVGEDQEVGLFRP